MTGRHIYIVALLTAVCWAGGCDSLQGKKNKTGAYVMVGPQDGAQAGNDDAYERYRQTLAVSARSRDVLATVLDDPRCKATSWYRKNFENLIPTFEASAEVAVVPNTSLLKLSFASDNPLEAAELANAWADALVEATTKQAQAMRTARIERLQKEQEQLKQQLEVQMQELAAMEQIVPPQQQATAAAEDYLKYIHHVAELNMELAAAKEEQGVFADNAAKGLADLCPQVLESLGFDPQLRQLYADLSAARRAMDAVADKGKDDKAFIAAEAGVKSIAAQVADREGKIRAARIGFMKEDRAKAVAKLQADLTVTQEWAAGAAKLASSARQAAQNCQARLDSIAQLREMIASLDRKLADERMAAKGPSPVWAHIAATRGS